MLYIDAVYFRAMKTGRMLQNRNVLLGVTGGIAAYKSAELVRLLVKAGATVRVVMSEAAQQFVGALTFQALSGNPVHTILLDPEAEAGMGHIELARWADLLVVAPATADFIARQAAGRADELLTTICRATSAPLWIAPAMNQQMWQDAATQQSVAQLVEQGAQLIGPDEGSQACGEVGPGRMTEPAEIVDRLQQQLQSGALQGQRVVVTAGPTRESIDPVRVITHRSSGEMGFAVARAAVEAGAEVTLIAGPVALSTPDHAKRIDVESAEEMAEAVAAVVEDADLFVATAAVADYRPLQMVNEKIKKGEEDEIQLVLTKNRDILTEVAALEAPPFTVGFAAETDHLREYAQQKRQRKQIDMIAANRVGQGVGFDVDESALTLFWEDGEQQLPQTTKQQLARQLIEIIAERMNEKG